jgi:hypothetical protein
MPRRLILHVGYYKTGTTALQDQLYHLRQELEGQGVLYPRAGRPALGNTSHSGLSFQELHRAGSRLPFWYTQRSEFAEYVAGNTEPARDSIAAEINASSADTVILSSEEFIRFGGHQGVPAEQSRELVRGLGVDHVTVVCYVRRPDGYLESWYNQLVKMGLPTHRLSPTLTQSSRRRHRYYGTHHTDYDRMIEYWAHQVGCDELIVRNFDQLRNGSIFEDFSSAVALPPLGDVEVPPGRENRRIDANFIEYVRVWSLFQPRENHGPLHALLESMEDEPKLPRRFDVYVMNRRARRRLHTYATPMNQRLGKLVGRDDGYFDDLDDMLSVPARARSDVAAFRFWAPYIDVAVRASGIA